MALLATAEGQQAIELRPINSLGRHPNNSIQLLDKIVSKEHCILEQRDGGFVLRDLGSLNGTYINGERVRGELVSGNYFEVLGVQPLIGRLISEADDHESITSPVAVISYEFWKRRFEMDPSIINQTVILNGHRFTVIGVTPPGFVGTNGAKKVDSGDGART